jgi:hypothetical protein
MPRRIEIDLGSFDPALTSPFLVDLAVRPP